VANTLTPSHPHTLTPSHPHTLTPSHPPSLSKVAAESVASAARVAPGAGPAGVVRAEVTALLLEKVLPPHGKTKSSIFRPQICLEYQMLTKTFLA